MTAIQKLRARLAEADLALATIEEQRPTLVVHVARVTPDGVDLMVPAGHGGDAAHALGLDHTKEIRGELNTVVIRHGGDPLAGITVSSLIRGGETQ